MLKSPKTPIIISVAMLILAILPLPHEYYIALRIVVCLTAVYLIFALRNDKEIGWRVFAYIAVAIIFNPLIPLKLPKLTWNIIDIGTATVFLWSKEEMRAYAKAILWILIFFTLSFGTYNLATEALPDWGIFFSIDEEGEEIDHRRTVGAILSGIAVYLMYKGYKSKRIIPELEHKLESNEKQLCEQIVEFENENAELKNENAKLEENIKFYEEELEEQKKDALDDMESHCKDIEKKEDHISKSEDYILILEELIDSIEVDDKTMAKIYYSKAKAYIDIYKDDWDFWVASDFISAVQLDPSNNDYRKALKEFYNTQWIKKKPKYEQSGKKEKTDNSLLSPETQKAISSLDEITVKNAEHFKRMDNKMAEIIERYKL